MEVKLKQMAMKKKIEKILEKEGPILFEKEEQLKNQHIANDQIKDLIELEMDIKTSKLINLYTNDLKEAELEIIRKETDLEKKILQLQKNNEEIEMHDLLLLKLLGIQVRILSNALIKKKLAIRKNTDHPLDKSLAEYPFVSSSYPTEKKLQKYLNDGKLVQFRDGFKKLSYQNWRGKLLTTGDELVLLSLGKLWLKNGKVAEFSFEFKELAAEMYMVEPTGGDYNNLLNSLNNLHATSYVQETYMDDKGLVRDGIEYQSFFSKFMLHGKEGRERACTIKMADVIHQNLLAGQYINVNILVFNDFQNDASKALYPFILSLLSSPNEQFNKDGYYALEMQRLIQHANIGEENPSRSRGIVMKAFEEFKSHDVIENANDIKLGNDYWVYVKPPKQDVDTKLLQMDFPL